MSNHRLNYRKRPHSPDIYSTPYSSSPPRSSSPLRTPYSSRYVHSYAYIRSSPEITPESAFRGVMDDFSWGYTSKYPGSAYTHSDRDFPPTSDFDASELSEDVDLELTSDSAPGPGSGVSSDSEDEEPQEDDDFGFSFSYEGNRTTFFRTSAERGQWKSNPMPLKPTLLQSRKSAPMHSRVATPTLVNPLRTISEPARSSSTPMVSSDAPQHLPDHITLETTSRDVPISILVDPITVSMEDGVESPHTLPSLSSDRESSLDVDVDTPSSPLPPSSPPMSPMSFSVSIVSRSVSPLLFGRDSSPLSEVPDDEDAVMDVPELLSVDDVPPKTETQPIVISPCTAIQSADTVHENSHPSVLLDNRETSGALSFPPPNSQDNDASSVLIAPNSSALTTPPPSSVVVEQDVSVDNKASSSSLNKVVKTRVQSVMRKKSATLQDKNGVDRCSTEIASTSTITAPDAKTKLVKEKRKKDTEKVKERERERGEEGEGPMKKKRKVEEEEGDVMPSKSQKSKKRVRVEVEVDSNSTRAGLKKKRNLKGGDGDGHASTIARTEKRADNSCHPLKTKTKTNRRSSSTVYSSEDEDAPNTSNPTSTPSPPLDPETAALHAQICGLLIETMAMSRASSLPVSSLFKLVMQDQPSLKAQRSEKEWMGIFDAVLHAGEAGRGSGVFGKVESSGKDNANRPLEAQWFYVPELDEDQDRATLIKAMMPRPAKRSETKKYKQYYWRPLDKISRWDPEDEL